jgi:hypothetical protein
VMRRAPLTGLALLAGARLAGGEKGGMDRWGLAPLLRREESREAGNEEPSAAALQEWSAEGDSMGSRSACGRHSPGIVDPHTVLCCVSLSLAPDRVVAEWLGLLPATQ